MEHEHTHKMCKTVFGLLMVVAGGALIGTASGNLDAVTATYVAGVALVLFGLGKLAHAFMLCPMCKGKEK